MNATATRTVDLVEELRLRRWARLNHVPADERDGDWHPIVLDEMSLRDAELDERVMHPLGATFAPLGERLPGIHVAHGAPGPRFLASPARSGELYYT